MRGGLGERPDRERAAFAARIQGELEAAVGKTIASVEVETTADRISVLRFRFADGSELAIDYFADYADDAGLDFDWRPTEPRG